MSEKGTLCHAPTRWEMMCVGGGGGMEGEMRGLEGGRKPLVCFRVEIHDVLCFPD